MFAGQEKNRPKSKLRIPKKLRFALLVVFLTLACATTVITAYGVSLFWRAEQYDLNRIAQHGEESMLYDCNNAVMSTLSGAIHRHVQFEDLPPHLINALLAREDEHFFDHGGVQYLSIIRSALRNVRSMRYAQGASTISMQLTRNVFELRDKSLDRKALEIVLTYLVESKYSKEIILTQYLNRIYFGENCYGLGDAAAHYFSKSVKDLDLNESATLIGLVRGPSIFNPVRSMSNAIKVRNETLDRMVAAEMISEQVAGLVKQQPITLKISPVDACTNTYPLMAVHHDLAQLDVDLGDKTSSIAVVTKMNKQIQDFTQAAVERCLAFIEGDGKLDDRWLDFFDAESCDQIWSSWMNLERPKNMPSRQKDGLAEGLQCVVLVLDSRLNSKGDVLAYTAGRDASDLQNRWGKTVKAGRTLAPFIFCAATQSDNGAVPIVSDNEAVTARKIGYQELSQYLKGLELFGDLPDTQHEEDLFTGQVDISLQNLARLYYCALHHGLDHKLNVLQAIYSQNRHLLYFHETEESPELIRRESARIVSTLPPFDYQEGKPNYINEALPDGAGQWCVVTNRRGVTVFVWVGYDNPQDSIVADETVEKMMQQFPLLMARQIHAESRRVLVADANRRKEEEKAKKEAAKK